MGKIAYILLCHRDAEAILAQISRLTAHGDYVVVHLDKNSGRGLYKKLTKALVDNKQVSFARRVKCGWGEWSLVQATLNALKTGLADFPEATNFYMVSGDCMPIKPAGYIQEFLSQHDLDFVESVDYFNGGWIKTGLKEERLIYRHFLNERKHKKLFYALLEMQKKFGIKRQIPAALNMMIGSQWWCLRRRTVEAVFEFIDRRPDVLRFFKTTWIPDETFFQTLVRHLVGENEIENRTPTFLMFSDYGMPVNFYNDHYDFLSSQDCLFARKISAEADQLKTRLDALYHSEETNISVNKTGRNIFQYLTDKGRHGTRFAPRFWHHAGTLGQDREVMVLVCKKRDVAERLLKAIKLQTNLPGLGFLFDEETTKLPALGGLGGDFHKRLRHRRAILRVLFDYYQTNQMLICLDPSRLDILHDFNGDSCTTKILDVECNLDRDFIVAWAAKNKLLQNNAPSDLRDQVAAALKDDIDHEASALRDANFPLYYRISETDTDAQNTAPMAEFLGVTNAAAGDIIAAEHIFTR